MLKSLAFLSLFATVSCAAAQSINQSADQTTGQSADPAQAAPGSQPAPIIRAYSQYGQRPGRRVIAAQIVESQPVSGVWLRSESSSALKTISATPQRTEVRLDHGRLNVNVHHPADHAEILVDLPGGQVTLFKDGLYTFNADTNTVRVLRGEAAAYLGSAGGNASSKPVKIKEDHQLSLIGTGAVKPDAIRSVEAYPYELTADLLPFDDHGDRAYEGGHYEEGYPPFAYPYYASGWGYPGSYGYPFSYGIGFGYGYYGGFHGYRGGFRR